MTKKRPAKETSLICTATHVGILSLEVSPWTSHMTTVAKENSKKRKIVQDMEKGVGAWSRNKGGKGIDIVGCPHRIQGFHNEWNPPRQSSGGASKQKEKKGEKSKRVAASRPNNISIKEHIEFGASRRDQRRWRFERADKGGGAVVISRQRWKREARKLFCVTYRALLRDI